MEMCLGRAGWRRVREIRKHRFGLAHLRTLVKFFVVPRGREAPAAVRHVEACPAGAALLGEVGISSRERAPALVARPPRGFLSHQVWTRHGGQWVAREGSRA